MKTKALNPLDAAWLYTESRDTPMHVAGMTPFELPKDAPPDFLKNIVTELKASTEFEQPWNLKLRNSFLKNPAPVWVEDHDVDIGYHVRHSALPYPGGERELGTLVERLHSRQLDFARPPWETHIVEGLENDRFALYTKMHHSLVDGIAGVKLLQRSMSTDQLESEKLPAFWSIPPSPRAPKSGSRGPSPTPAEAMRGILGNVKSQVGSVTELGRAFGDFVRASRKGSDDLVAPFVAPKSVFNGRVKEARRFATQRYELDRLKDLSKAADCTLNDVVLAICGGALRRFMKETSVLPDQSLTAGIPVSVRPSDGDDGGNAITFIISTLGTDIADPMKRLDAIRASTIRAKEHVQSLPKAAMMQYTMVLMAPQILGLLTGIGGRTRPMFNVTISNVPGPREPLFFRGARMEAIYPVSLLSHGQALNITCQSYAGYLCFGFTGCRDSIPHMQRIAVYTGEALDELEKGIRGGGGRKRVTKPRKAAAK